MKHFFTGSPFVSGTPLHATGEVRGKIQMIQYGISSAGLGCHDLTANYPEIYTHIGYYIKWILDNMHGDSA